MAQATEQQRNTATSKAALAVICVAVFATVFALTLQWLAAGTPEDPELTETIEVTDDTRVEPFYVLLIGSDSRRGTALYTGQSKDQSQSSAYADILTLMRIDPSTYTITLVSIPRDTAIRPDSPKINESLLSNDPTDVVTAVERLTGVRADYYMMTTFITFANLINALGGIDIDVPNDITVDDPATGKKISLKAGKNQHLDGSQALALARARYEYGDDQEAKRQRNVRAIEEKIIRKVLAMDGSIDIEHIVATLEHDTYTDMDLASMGGTIVDFVLHANEVTIYEGTGKYKGGTRRTDGEWVVESDDESWMRLMEIVDRGQDPSDFIAQPKF